MKTLLAIGISLCLLSGRAADVPTTLTELDRWYVEPPTNENAALFFLQGHAALQIKEQDWIAPDLPLLGYAKLPPPGRRMRSAMTEAIAEFVQRNESCIPYFARGSKCSQSRYPVKMMEGWEALLPHLSHMNLSNTALLLRAMWHANAGREKEAVETLLMNLAIVRSLEPEPILVSQLRRVDLIPDIVSVLEQILNRSAVSIESLEQLQKTLGDFEQRESSGTNFTRALIGDRAMNVFDIPLQKQKDLFRQIAQEPHPLDQADLSWTVSSLVPQSQEMDREQLNAAYTALLAVWKQPYPGRMKFRSICSERIADADKRKLPVSAVCLRGFKRILASEAESLASLRLAQVAIALEQFRHTHANRYPQFLSYLTPVHLSKVPSDPFDGKPLRYRRNGNGYILYSIGSDLVSQGGQRTNRVEPDIVFEMVKPSMASSN
jgi:hypothetical protein